MVKQLEEKFDNYSTLKRSLIYTAALLIMIVLMVGSNIIALAFEPWGIIVPIGWAVFAVWGIIYSLMRMIEW